MHIGSKAFRSTLGNVRESVQQLLDRDLILIGMANRADTVVAGGRYGEDLSSQRRTRIRGRSRRRRRAAPATDIGSHIEREQKKKKRRQPAPRNRKAEEYR